jgi:dinuclear metal center YbgI/SA1388 family protein
MPKIKEIISEIESIAPLSLQEDYDNAGLIIGNQECDCKAILLTIDVTENIVVEAKKKGVNLIISHHPLIFSGLKKINGKSDIEKSVILAIKNDIAVYAAHTNLDNILEGVNHKIAEKLKLKDCQILSPLKKQLKKLVTFIPVSHIEEVSKAIFDVGAGHIGNYDSCGYRIEGKGSFRALDGAKPFVGQKGALHFEEEIRFETIFTYYQQKKIIEALLNSHPYEEVAYDIYPLDNDYKVAGAGIIGYLDRELPETEFLKLLKEVFKLKIIRHTELTGKPVKNVAVCGGSGSFLLKDAMQQNADVFISADFKYHQFFGAEKKILIADIGHFESEHYTNELFFDILKKKFSTFAIYFSEVNTNPVHYF